MNDEKEQTITPKVEPKTNRELPQRKKTPEEELKELERKKVELQNKVIEKKIEEGTVNVLPHKHCLACKGPMPMDESRTLCVKCKPPQ